MSSAWGRSDGSALRRAIRKLGLTFVVVAGLAAGGVIQARTPETPAAVQPVALTSLPQEAQTTYRLVHDGGPFPYRKDGDVFGNRERLLPPKARGQYREYTVKTPGAADRGARRIVCSGTPPARPESCYYTDDHYTHFRRIVQ